MSPEITLTESNCASCSEGNTENESRRKKVPCVPTKLTLADVLGGWKVRLGIGRMSYIVEPGLYSIGNPDENSPVLVSANYKLTFDILRKNLSGFSCWLLILDTKGINVWCAAGKGTFGTDELVRRIENVKLHEKVAHRNLILPQLGAPGIDSGEVKRRTGFSVAFGPVRSSDIQAFISSGNKASREMRLVGFTFADRLVLTPMELMPALKKSLPILGCVFISNQFARRPFDKADSAAYAGAILTGCVITPLLLPYIPGRAFAWKGWIVGMLGVLGVVHKFGGFAQGNRTMSAGRLLLFPALSSFLALNFTGASTYTSPSGVRKEMQKALPLIITAGAVGAAVMLGSHFFGKGCGK